MKQLKELTPEQFARAVDRLRSPKPGSRTEAAIAYGIDVTLLMEQLRLTPAQRARKLEAASRALESLRGAARKRH